MYILLKDLPKELSYSPIERINTVIMEVISIYEINHRKICKPFLIQQGFKLEEDKNKIIGIRGNEGKIEIEFSENGLINNVKATLEARKKKPWWKLW